MYLVDRFGFYLSEFWIKQEGIWIFVVLCSFLSYESNKKVNLILNVSHGPFWANMKWIRWGRPPGLTFPKKKKASEDDAV